VNGAAPAHWAPPDAGRNNWALPIVLLVAFGSVATVGAAIAGDGSIIVAVAPIVACLLLVAVWYAPMRITLFGLIFLCLASDSIGEGPWDSPLAPLGRFLTVNLNKTIPVDALALPVMALVVGYLLVIYGHRRISESGIDQVSPTAAASAMRWSIGLSLVTVFVMCALGRWRGGDIQMAKIQVQHFVLLLLIAYLLAASLRGIRDYRVLGSVILLAACSKAFMAVWVTYVVHHSANYATAHGDSLTFVGAATMLIVQYAEKPVRRHGQLCVVFLPILFAGMVANTRRLAWVEIAATVLILYFVSPRTRVKRLAARTVLLALPVVLAYVAAGWTSDSSLFAPVRLFRSVGDAEENRSTWDRDVENYNLLAGIKENPLAGTGFGHPYFEVVKGDDISAGFKEYRFLPHNSLLGLLSFSGALGFTGLSAAVVIGVFLSGRSYRWARVPEQRMAAFSALAMIVIYQIQCWGDIGFSEKKAIFLVGPALAVAGQLAVSTGAWATRPPQANA
jgi:hypothetical protein